MPGEHLAPFFLFLEARMVVKGTKFVGIRMPVELSQAARNRRSVRKQQPVGA
jgi:hypothetical protein